MSKLFIKIVLINTMFIIANSVFSQIEWQSYQSETTLPKKAKLKTVKYKSYDYAAVGYIYEKQFVNGQELSFYSTNTETNVIPVYIIPIPVSNTKLTTLIISGIYFLKDEISYLESTINQEGSWSSVKSSIHGIFRISNTYDGKGLTIKPSDAKELSIKTADIIDCYSFYEDNKYPITLQKNSNNNNYDYKIEFDDRTLEVIITTDYLKKTLFSAIDNIFKNTKSSVTQNRISIKFDDYINNSKDVKLTFNNGDFFVGKVEKNHNNQYIPIEGKYIFSNGEIFVGKMDNYKGIWTNGEWRFTDGSFESGDWLGKYNVNFESLSSALTMTEKHKLAIQLYEEKQQKLQAEKIAMQQAEEKKKIAEQKRKQDYINKYGEYYGTLISKGQLDVGMSQAMVSEVWNKDFFIVSKSIRSGNTIEIWEFSKDKMQLAIINEGAKKDTVGVEAALATLFMIEFLEQLGEARPPRMIIFTNNKLTDIYR